MRTALALILTAAMLALPTAARAQTADGHDLEDFVKQVSWLWGIGDVAALVDLLPSRDRVVLDTGSGPETVTSRHAAAALRDLFASRESDGARAIRITIAGGSPARGFGELAWRFRARGGPAQQTQSVYVGAVRQGNVWRIDELRIMP
jgi:hypothetical protein